MSRYRFIDEHAERWPIRVMCGVLGVSTSGFYDWRRRGPSRRAREDFELAELIELVHDDSGGTYGSPRIHAELRRRGVRVGKERVERLMRERGLSGISGRKRSTKTTIRDPQARPAPDLVERDFDVDAPDRLWCSDITYVPTAEGWLYAAVIIDVFSRRVVGWSMATHLRTELALDALEMALARRQPPEGLIHHSDQGCQYTAREYRTALERAGVVESMGAVGSALDNALVESFIASLKVELIDRYRWPTRQAARTAIFRWIEHTYNRKRIHSALNYRTPVEHEEGYAHTQPTATVAHAA